MKNDKRIRSEIDSMTDEEYCRMMERRNRGAFHQAFAIIDKNGKSRLVGVDESQLTDADKEWLKKRNGEL